MAGFTVSLAGVPIGITPLCPDIRTFFTEFLCEDKPVFSITTTEEDLDKERTYADRTWEEQIDWPRRYLETVFLLRTVAGRMPEYDTVLFHGSVLALDGRAYLFAAPSGTGKTTHTRLWLEKMPGAHVLNGDKPFLKVLPDGRVLACGGPWKGKEKLGRNESLPLEAICLLERAETNRIEQIDPKKASGRMLRQTHLPEDPAATLRTMQVLDRICRGVRLYRLGCNMEPEAAEVSTAAMLPKEKTENGNG